MTTKIVELEAELPMSLSRKLAMATTRFEDAEAKVLRAAEVTHRARDACNGSFVGIELDNRLKALGDCAQAEHAAVTELQSARAALMKFTKED